MAASGIYLVTWRDGAIPVRVSAAGGRYVVGLGQRTLEVDLAAVAHGAYSLLIEGRSYEVDIVPEEEGVTVFVRGEPYRLRIQDERTARLRALAAKGGLSPGTRSVATSMPGKVVRHLVKVGDAVEAGQGVIVVEAMKMENELKAPGPGTVREIRAPEGALVPGGATLVVIE